MNKILLAACVVAGLAIAAPVEARKSKQSDNIDFSTISCAQFMDDLSRASEDDAGALLLWLDGYLSVRSQSLFAVDPYRSNQGEP